jgi:hypothetical protein
MKYTKRGSGLFAFRQKQAARRRATLRYPQESKALK